MTNLRESCDEIPVPTFSKIATEYMAKTICILKEICSHGRVLHFCQHVVATMLCFS